MLEVFCKVCGCYCVTLAEKKAKLCNRCEDPKEPEPEQEEDADE